MLKKFILILTFSCERLYFIIFAISNFIPPPKPKYAHPKQLCKQNKVRELQFETYLVAVLKELIDVLTSTIITTTEKMPKSSERLCSFSRRVQKDGTRLNLRMEITLVSFVNLCKTFLNLKCYFVTSLMEKQSERHDRNVWRVNEVFVE